MNRWDEYVLKKQYIKACSLILDLFKLGMAHDMIETNTIAVDLKDSFLYYDYALGTLYTSRSYTTTENLSNKVFRGHKRTHYIDKMVGNEIKINKNCTVKMMKDLLKEIRNDDQVKF